MKLKGKCRTCLGCALLEDEAGFKGRKKCKYYARDNNPVVDMVTIAIFIGITCLIVFGLLKLGYSLYERFNMLAGG